MTVVRWGILGAANFAKEHMARAIHAAEGGKLAALATSSAEKAEGFKAFAPDLKVHSSYDALLEDPDIDAVYIPLPNHLHVEWTLRAVAAGKAVLCEKPIAMNANEIDRLIEARDDAGVLVAEAYMIVHHPQWRKARRLLHEGKIGTLVDTQVRFSFNNPDPENIRNQANKVAVACRILASTPLARCATSPVKSLRKSSARMWLGKTASTRGRMSRRASRRSTTQAWYRPACRLSKRCCSTETRASSA